MKPSILTRAAVGAAASLTVILPLTGCSSESELTSSQAPSPQSTPPATTPPSTEDQDRTTEYADGAYTARGVYGGAPSYMDFTVTIEDGVITDVESGLMEDNNDTSRGYQEDFAAALPDEVIGESIDDLEIGVVAGASGCADGFNDALAKIRDQAATD